MISLILIFIFQTTLIHFFLTPVAGAVKRECISALIQTRAQRVRLRTICSDSFFCAIAKIAISIIAAVLACSTKFIAAQLPVSVIFQKMNMSTIFSGPECFLRGSPVS